VRKTDYQTTLALNPSYAQQVRHHLKLMRPT
jgi:hypothetical protein